MAQWTTVTQNMNAPNSLLRQYNCSEPDGSTRADLQGIDALTGTAVQNFHQQLLQIGLPFRVSVRGVAQVSSTRDGEDGMDNTWGFILPPVSVNPLQLHGMNTWADFIHLLRQQMTTYAEELHDMASGVTLIAVSYTHLTLPTNREV